MNVTDFLETHFRHFNARELRDAARSFGKFVDDGGKMMVTLAGAMSTGELGLSLAEMIRKGKVHAVTCTAANLEEDLFNLVAHDEYKTIQDWRALSVEDEVKLRDAGFNRVTDTCIPETVMRHLEHRLTELWIKKADDADSWMPAEFMFALLDDPGFTEHFQVPRENSWVAAAKDAGIPIYTPGIEDSTLGNIYAARVFDGTVPNHSAIATGTEQMEKLIGWYDETSQDAPIGIFQIGGGIAGDFPICVVPLLKQDLQKDVRLWGYFCQISDAVTSYGGYSGAVPNEKITWYKLDPESPKFMIQSDASICAPLIFAHVLGW
ncbi:homospermidine synthase (spermidine-specific) [Neorhodopirellula lusitana]|uniref:Homospermidine synthase (Spermidine-specific) n=1 Tax=Neorhodopirellula lusitana TaxID=445327 RepID=A0ABY1QLR9_9BACT|nr:deoxyhypusine synthase family protein [Neorhodopirellula lusitana]SMP74798.1 homospermidine synthase (spermidine-specific) [Neorhodopirellula lusitana]